MMPTSGGRRILSKTTTQSLRLMVSPWLRVAGSGRVTLGHAGKAWLAVSLSVPLVVVLVAVGRHGGVALGVPLVLEVSDAAGVLTNLTVGKLAAGVAAALLAILLEGHRSPLVGSTEALKRLEPPPHRERGQDRAGRRLKSPPHRGSLAATRPPACSPGTAPGRRSGGRAAPDPCSWPPARR